MAALPRHPNQCACQATAVDATPYTSAWCHEAYEERQALTGMLSSSKTTL